MNSSVETELIERLESLIERASTLQSGKATAMDAKALRSDYQDWFAEAVLVVPADRVDEFRDMFEGGEFITRIRSFLSDPFATNVLYDPAQPKNALTSQPWQYPFESTFRPNAEAQITILKEARARGTVPTRSEGDIFVVHGHDEAMTQSVARKVERMTNCNVKVLREEPSKGRTLIEKFEDVAEPCVFALALLSPDDQCADGERRARQNVVFEAGYFVGKIGRSRTVLLYKHPVALPSDLHGISYVAFETGWEVAIARELRAVGISADPVGIGLG